MKRTIGAGVAMLVMAMTPAAQAQVAGLGLTEAQLEDADLVGANGKSIGEVEHVVIGPGGKATALIVEIDRPDPQRDKLVRIGLDGLKAVPKPDDGEEKDGEEYDIVTTMPVARLLAMPTWRPR